jgi:hypothetical protein
MKVISTVRVVMGTRGGAVDWSTAPQNGRQRVRFPIGSFVFLIDINLPGAPWHCGRQSCGRQ